MKRFNLDTVMPTKQPRRYEPVQLDPDVVQQIRERAAKLKLSMKAVVQGALFAPKTDPRFRFEEPRGKR